ncbi:uncharacterized protein si:ch211-188c16.1 [Cyprinodon tularosa]|uniref:uncharacterized protein si:ch211-188c16.1 n=1 Tax=Cyprinodon tularosa TaxID=77115 RepID=UPI0018E1DE79|nr:uncharacterized protein si:ch211-188c16.1 [Cyprinodon tularosa]
MEEEGQINFKAIRAKFQEEGFLAHSKNGRPAVAEKPKLLQPHLGHSSSMVSGTAMAVENQTPEVPRVLFRDGHWSSGGRRPIPFPPHPRPTSPSSQLANGENSSKHSFKDRHMPPMLPVLTVKDHKVDPPAGKEHKLESETERGVFPHAKIKKKGLLLPFKSAKASKHSADNGDDPTYDDLSYRPGSATSELCTKEKRITEEQGSLQSDPSDYSPESAVTSPPPATYPDSENRILSTLEKAKKKLSRRQIMIPSKPKSLPSPDYSCRGKTFPLSPRNPDGVGSDVLLAPPVCLPHFACISARPFFKANNSARKPTLEKLLVVKPEQLPLRSVEACSPQIPLKKQLPEMWTLGAAPVKPTRPPTVDLSSYHPGQFKEVSPVWCQTPKNEEFSVLDAPDFPDFETSELETPEGEPVDVAALEIEALNIVVGNLTTPLRFEVPDYVAPDCASSVWDPVETNRSHVDQDLNLGSPHIIPLDPASFPEPVNLPEFPELPLPEPPSYSEEAAVDANLNSGFAASDVGAAEKLSIQEEPELVDHPASGYETQTQPSKPHQNSYYETCDNLYEDVEIKKLLESQISAKQKSRLKLLQYWCNLIISFPPDPYANRNSKKGEACLHKRPRHPWQNTSPNTADHKDQRKREKQRLEKERKEQKEREKKENEMKKKFKVTGQEEAMYHAKVTGASKVRKNDLPVKSGDTVSIIRTTNCPKGKWLARDSNNKYGYISVMNVELNIKDMLELGKKAQAAGRGAYVEPDTISIGSRSSNPPLLTSSCKCPKPLFTDDSEEWACEDEVLSASYESQIAQQTVSEPEISCVHVEGQHTLSDSNLEDQHTQTGQEALQKLALLFQQSNDEFGDGGAASIKYSSSYTALPTACCVRLRSLRTPNSRLTSQRWSSSLLLLCTPTPPDLRELQDGLSIINIR